MDFPNTEANYSIHALVLSLTVRVNNSYFYNLYNSLCNTVSYYCYHRHHYHHLQGDPETRSFSELIFPLSSGSSCVSITICYMPTKYSTSLSNCPATHHIVNDCVVPLLRHTLPHWRNHFKGLATFNT
jgi:hypothetical protein